MGDEYIRDILTGTEKRVIHGDTRIVGSLEVTGSLTNNSEAVGAVEVPVLSAAVILTNAQIKALPSAPVEIVPAPGINKIIHPLGGRVRVDNSAGAYDTFSDNPFWQLVYISSPFAQEASGLITVSVGLLTPGIYSASIPPLLGFNASEGYVISSLAGDDGARVNTGLGIADVYNGVDDYTGGNAANSTKVTVLYTIIDV